LSLSSASALALASILVCCERYTVLESPEVPDSCLIGKDGPRPFPGWTVVERRGHFDGSNYYDTGGWWYIMLEDSAFNGAVTTQVYVNPDADSPVDKWQLFKAFRVSCRFLYIDDHLRRLWGWTYVVFIYMNT